MKKPKNLPHARHPKLTYQAAFFLQTLQRYHLVKIAHSEGMSKICTGPEFTGPLWALVRGHISQFALTRVRQYMIALDLSGDTTLKPCTTAFKRAWGLPCPHLLQRLMRERQPLEIDDFDMHWRLDRDTLPTINWSDIAQPPERVTQRGRQDRSSRRFPSEFERWIMPCIGLPSLQ